jgi:hypothetical protein
MARNIDLAQYKRQLADGTVGGRILYHTAPPVRWAGVLALQRAVGADRQMRNLFRAGDPVTGAVVYDFIKKDVAEVRFKPAGMMTIIKRQGHGDPMAAAEAAIPRAAERATKFVIRMDY